MPKSGKRKRSRSSSEDFESFAKKLKRFLDTMEEPPNRQEEEQPRRRRTRRIIESSSRETSPTSENQNNESPVSREVEDPGPSEQPSTSKDCNETALADILDAGTSPAINQQTTTNAEVAPVEPSLDDAVLQILGDDPTSTIEYGKDIHKELATRFEHLATSGLTKEARKDLCEKYLIPSNCKLIGAPKLNAEIKGTLNESLKKRDKAIEARQKQLASALACVAQIATDQLLSKDTNHDVLKKAVDAGRLLADIQYAESTTRRHFAAFSLKKEAKEQVLNTKIDQYLFGESLSDTIKTAKAVNKIGTDLKAVVKNKTRPTASTSKPTTKTLNWKTQAPARRQPEPPRTREPASTRNLPATSSKQSWRPTRRR